MKYNNKPITKVLVLCEESGKVRRAFKNQGANYVWSCDLLPSQDNDPYHLKKDVFECLNYFETNDVKLDLIIAFPPCQFMASSGNRWHAKSKERQDAIKWTLRLWDRCKALADFVAFENPVGALSTALAKHDPHMFKTYIQPWQHGHGETKKTGLFLSRLPNLLPSSIVEGRENRIWKMPPSPTRTQQRSETYTGIARAMASQWLPYVKAMQSIGVFK